MTSDEVIAFISNEIDRPVTRETVLMDVCGDSLDFVDLLLTLSLETGVELDKGSDYTKFTVQDVLNVLERGATGDGNTDRGKTAGTI